MADIAESIFTVSFSNIMNKRKPTIFLNMNTASRKLYTPDFQFGSKSGSI